MPDKPPFKKCKEATTEISKQHKKHAAKINAFPKVIPKTTPNGVLFAKGSWE